MTSLPTESSFSKYESFKNIENEENDVLDINNLDPCLENEDTDINDIGEQLDSIKLNNNNNNNIGNDDDTNNIGNDDNFNNINKNFEIITNEMHYIRMLFENKIFEINNIVQGLNQIITKNFNSNPTITPPIYNNNNSSNDQNYKYKKI